MAIITPFTGLYYNSRKVSNPGSVITPPHVFLDDSDQIRYYAQHPLNAVRLHAGIKFPTDSEANNWITRARRYFTHWLEEKVLVYDSAPAFYVCAQQDQGTGQHPPLISLIARIPVTPDGGLVVTASPPEEADAERQQWLHTLQLNITPVIAVYSDPARAVLTIIQSRINVQPPRLEARQDEFSLRLWAIQDEDTIARLQKRLSDQPIYLVAGEAEYKAHLAWARETDTPPQLLAFLYNTIDLGMLMEDNQVSPLEKAEDYYRQLPVGLIMDHLGAA